MILVLLAREQQGLATHEKGVKAGAKVSPAQVECLLSGIVLQELSQAETGPRNSPRHSKGTRPCFLWAIPAKAAEDRAVL